MKNLENKEVAEGLVLSPRFIVLAGDRYYPRGWHDFRGQFTTLEQANSYVGGFLSGAGSLVYAQVVDLQDYMIESERDS